MVKNTCVWTTSEARPGEICPVHRNEEKPELPRADQQAIGGQRAPPDGWAAHQRQGRHGHQSKAERSQE
jgi:hypothetical protein